MDRCVKRMLSWILVLGLLAVPSQALVKYDPKDQGLDMIQWADQVFETGSGLIRVTDPDTGLWGALDGAMNIVIPLQYDGGGLVENRGYIFGYRTEGGQRVSDLYLDSGKCVISGLKGEMMDVVADAFVVYQEPGEEGKVGLISLENMADTGCIFLGVLDPEMVDTEIIMAKGDIFGTGVITVAYDRQLELLEIEFPKGFATLKDGATEGLIPVVSGKLGGGIPGSILESRPKAKAGFIDLTGKMVIDPIYANVQPFSDGLAWVTSNDTFKAGAIDRQGNVVVPFLYDSFSAFNNGWAVAEQDGKQGVIDKQGNELVPVVYDSIVPIVYRHFLARQGDRYDIYDLAGTKTGSKQAASLEPLMVRPNGTSYFGYSTAEGLVGTCDETGRTVIAEEKRRLVACDDGLLWTQAGLLDHRGEMVYPFPAGAKMVPTANHLISVEGERIKLLPLGQFVHCTAVPSTSPVLVDGKQMSPAAYNIDGQNYFKLRDFAAMIGGSKKCFDVQWDEGRRAIELKRGVSYTVRPGDLAPGAGAAVEGVKSSAPLYVDGALVDALAYNLQGQTYFRLQDLGSLFDVSISYDAATRTVKIDTTSPYAR